VYTAVDWGLLILRVGIGIMFIVHGYSKMFAGPQKWLDLGQTMGLLGIHFAPVFWGCMCAFAEFFGGIFLIIGLATRMYAFLLFINMLVAANMHFRMGQGVGTASHAIELGVVFVSLLIMGAGRLSLDTFFRTRLAAK
jgi:putative oxidoreductase